jgi:hypothetical protein
MPDAALTPFGAGPRRLGHDGGIVGGGPVTDSRASVPGQRCGSAGRRQARRDQAPTPVPIGQATPVPPSPQ